MTVVLTLTLGLFIAVIATACTRGGMSMSMMNDPEAMDQMMSDPKMSSMMMDRMMNDPKMMQQMMDRMMNDPKMMQQMMDSMMKNPQACITMMDKMMENPEHRRLMVDHMTKHAETCRNMMQEMAGRMDEPAAREMMNMCSLMMKESGSTTSTVDSAPAAAPNPSSSGASAAVQEHTINVGDGFSPASIKVQKGKPVRLHFRRGNEPTCATEVVFPKLNIRRPLPANETTTVQFTPQNAETLAFGCGMNMLGGKLVVQ